MLITWNIHIFKLCVIFVVLCEINEAISALCQTLLLTLRVKNGENVLKCIAASIYILNVSIIVNLLKDL